MAYTPYDWTQNLQHRQEYIRDRLREGSPVVGLSYREGVLLLTMRRTQDKIFEIYDRLMFSGIGHQSDLEALRLAAIDFAHREGFSRSAGDVTAQRVVGVALSPVLKKGFGDFFSNPLVLRAIFAEMGATPQEDVFYLLDFDGEFTLHRGAAVAAGSEKSEEELLRFIEQDCAGNDADLSAALKLALQAWARGRYRGLLKEEAAGEELILGSQPLELLKQELGEGVIEAAVLERNVSRENKFRHLRADEIRPVREELLSGK